MGYIHNVWLRFEMYRDGREVVYLRRCVREGLKTTIGEICDIDEYV